jgi:ABC-type antimicrobial peptide transport system permease subunit
MESITSSSGADLQVVQKDAMMVLLSAVDDSVGAELRQLPGVRQVAGTVIGAVQMTDAPYFMVAGEDPQSFALAHYKLIAGQTITGKRQILLGKIAAKNFRKEIGQTFQLNDVAYRVVGIYETGVSLEDGGAVIHLADAQRAFDRRRQVNAFNLKLDDPRRTDELKKLIEERWPELTAVRAGDTTQEDTYNDMYRSMGWFLGLFAVLVGGLGMMNAMLMSVFERTREIGVLRALGWSRGRVVRMILGESLLLAVLGGALGMGLGIGLAQLARLSPAVESLLQGVFTPAMFVQAFVIALLLGAVGGVYPAWRAARLAPVEAMRAESGAAVHWGGLTKLLARMAGGAALRNLYRRPARTLMTMLGLGIGVGFIIALIAMTEGSRLMFTKLMSAGEADLVAEQANASDASLSVIDERIADRLKARPEFRSVSKMVIGFSSVPGMQFLIVFGLDPREDYLNHYQVREGRMIARSREIILGRTAANGMEKEVGETVILGGSRYRVVGIFENGAAFEDMGAVVMLKDAQSMFGKHRQVSFIAMGLNDPARADEIALALEREFPAMIVSRSAKMTERMQDFMTMDAIFNALVVLTIVVGGIVMINVMMMSLFERTQEIGVLRALGWRRGRVLRMVLVESLALSLLSGLAGIAVGVGLGYLLRLTPGYGDILEPAYPPQLFAQVLALSLSLGVIGGIYPAWRATRLDPIEALRYE